MKYILAFITFVIFSYCAFEGYHFVKFIAGPVGTNTKDTYIEVKHKESLEIISKNLHQENIIENEKYFKIFMRIFKYTPKIKAGYYKFNGEMSAKHIADILISGKSEATKVTIPEGYTMYQIADILNKSQLQFDQDSFLSLCKDKEFLNTLGIDEKFGKIISAEGYLYPDTYFIPINYSPEQILSLFVKHFNETLTTDLIEKAKELKMTINEVVTLASIVEKETGAKSERPKIASVFYNRLKIGMRLQTDPTVLYGMGIFNFQGNITKHDLQTPTPYNTYTISGLPPGAIANPGKDAIKAVLFPDSTKYLYFVSHNDGTHEFTTNYEDHLKAVRNFQLNKNAKEGKSWKQLSPIER